MKRSLHVALLAGLLAFVVSPALGQGFSPERMRQRLETQDDALLAALDLNDAQATAAGAVLADAREARFKLMERRGRDGREALRDSMQVLEAHTETRLAEILTEAELERYRTLRAEQATRRRRPRNR